MKQHSLVASALLLAALVTYVVARALGLVGGGVTAVNRSLVVATSTIAAGQPIEQAHLQLVPWPTEQVPEGAFDKLADLSGRVVRQTVYSGELLLEPKLAPVDARGGLSSTIESGKRAISVRVNDVVGVAGFALPGSYVDVLVSAKDDAHQPFSTTVLTRVKVLAAAQETESDQGGAKPKPKVVNAVTLELTPLEAEKLDLARSIGVLSLVLRNDSDTVDVDSAGTRLNNILRGGSDVAVRPAATGAAPARPRPVARESVPVTSIRGITRREELP